MFWVQLLLQRLPVHLRSLTEADAGGLPMVEGPDLDAYVFVTVERAVPGHRFDTGEEIDLERGDVLVIRYRAIQALLAGGSVKLI